MDGRVKSVAKDNCPAEAVVQKASSSHGCCASQTAPSDEGQCDGEEEEDGCTPFCSCQCCGMVFLQSIAKYKPLLPPVPVKQLLSYLQQAGQDFPHLIWQPPPFTS